MNYNIATEEWQSTDDSLPREEVPVLGFYEKGPVYVLVVERVPCQEGDDQWWAQLTEYDDYEVPRQDYWADINTVVEMGAQL